MITSALTTEIATLTKDPRVLVAGHFGPSWADAVTPDMSVHDIEQKHLPHELAPYFKRHDIPAKNWGAAEVLRDRKTRELVADLTAENLKNPSQGLRLAQVAFKDYQQPLTERWLEVRKEASLESGLLAAARRAQVFWSAANQAHQIAQEVEDGTVDDATRRWLGPLLRKYGYAPKARKATILPEDRAVQVVRELTKDAIIQRLADRMPKDHKELSRLESDDDFREVVVEVAKNHITEPEARRFKVSVGNVYDRAIDYWQEGDIDPQDKKGREVAKNKLSNLYAATNLVLNYRHTQLPEWLRVALNERDLSHRTAMEHPNEQAKQQYLREHPGADPTNHTVAPSAKDDSPKGKGKGVELVRPGTKAYMIHHVHAPKTLKEFLDKGIPPIQRFDATKLPTDPKLQGVIRAAVKLSPQMFRKTYRDALDYVTDLHKRSAQDTPPDREIAHAFQQANALFQTLVQAQKLRDKPEGRPAWLDKTGGDDPMVALEEMAGFEEGVPADPTEQMSEEDAAEWEKQNAIHRSEFTASQSDPPDAMSIHRVMAPASIRHFFRPNVPEGAGPYGTGNLAPDHDPVLRDIMEDALRTMSSQELNDAYGTAFDYFINLKHKVRGSGEPDPELVRASKQADAVHRALSGASLILSAKPDKRPAWARAILKGSPRVAKTLDADRQRILDHLRQERWEVDTDSDPPFATTPDGVTRVWFEAKNVYIVHGRNPDDLVREEAKSMGLGDLGKVSGPSFVYEVGEWVRDSTRDGGVTRDRVEPVASRSASSSLPSGTPSDKIHAAMAPAVLHSYLKKDLPAIRNITDRELERDRVVREVIAEAVGMRPEELHKLYEAAFHYNLDMSRRSMDLDSEDPGSLKALRQAHALKMAFVYARDFQKVPNSKRPAWLRAMTKTGSNGVDPSLDPIEELRKMNTQDTTDTVDEMAALEEMARFEEGSPADPTEQMSPEDAAEWKKQHAINRNNFKTAGAQVDLTKVGEFAKWLDGLSADWKNKWRTAVMTAAETLKKSTDKSDRALHEIIGRALDGLIEVVNAGAKLDRAVRMPEHRFVASEVAEDPMGSMVAAMAIDRSLMLERPAPVASDLTTDREAAAGLYGYSKRVEKTSDTAARRVSRAALRLARAAYDRDPRVLAFLSARARKGCRAAGLLAYELKEAGALSSKSTPRRAGESGGLYGWGERASDLGLRACADLEREAGTIASDLLDKKDARKLASFLREHASRAECPRAALLAYAMPDDEDEDEDDEE